MKHASEFLKTVPTGAHCAVPVRCSSCKHSSPLRAAPELVNCSMLDRSKNAELVRVCGSFEARQ